MIWKYPSETLEDSKSVDRSGRAANSIRSMPDEDVDKLFQQKAEDDGKNVVAEDQTVRSSKKSTSSCTSKYIIFLNVFLSV